MSVPRAVAAAPDATGATMPGIQLSFAPIVDRDLPAVVNISSSRVVKNNGNQMAPFLMDPFFRQFFGDGRQFQQPNKQWERGLGSGVIVRPDGYLLTNNHVIDGATDITVTMLDKREFKAKLVGTDSRTDIAVLKVDATNLPTLAFADSSKVRVGDVVLAMGEPFGLGQTVTMGIISAKGRNGLNIEGYEDFIQTDAAINPGNSGGALVDARGNLIGINTAILSHGGGGNEGIGFAIPANMARNVMDQVMAHGKVIRGYMGVAPQDITPAMAKALRLTELRGVLMGGVVAGGPAAQAGLQRGDVVTAVNGEPIEDMNQFRLKISMLAPGTTVQLKILRDGSAKMIPVKLIEYPNETAQNRGSANSNSGSTALDGVSVDELDSQTLGQLGLPQTTKGVVVTGVAGGSPASTADLEQGDVIQEIDHARITNVADYNRAVARAMGHTMLLLINRQGNTRYIAVEPQ